MNEKDLLFAKINKLESDYSILQDQMINRVNKLEADNAILKEKMDLISSSFFQLHETFLMLLKKLEVNNDEG